MSESDSVEHSEAATPLAPDVAPARDLLPPAPDEAPACDPVIVELCAPISEADPCGSDLDLEGDADYFNFFAQVDGILPTSFFSIEDGKPFDPTTIDIGSQLKDLRSLLKRSHDVRLMTVQARLAILNRDLAGFSAALASIGEWLDRYWDGVHPRPQDGSLDARLTALSALELSTVVFPLQYAPLFEARRIGPVTYRGWMIANGEARPRLGDAAVSAAAISEAIGEAEAADLAAARKHIALLNTSLGRIRIAFATHGSSVGLETLSALAGKMLAFIDPHAEASVAETSSSLADEGDDVLKAKSTAGLKAGPPPKSIADATQALAAIADYYSCSEPSSPTLPLVRQAHQLIGKSFFEIMTILVPSQVDKAAFQIGADQVFDLPVGKLSGLSSVTPAGLHPAGNGNGAAEAADSQSPSPPRYRVESRSQAIVLLELVQRYFRVSEPSSPVPMLCERARALAEQDFMGVLRDVLPKSALKNITADK